MLNLHHLPQQAPDETVELMLRRHVFVVLVELALLLLLAAVPLAAQQVILRVQPDFFDDEVPTMLFTLLLFTWELFVWLFLYRAFLDYYLDVWIVTNKRIISIEQEGLFNRHFSEQKLFRVQDVTSLQKGFFATFLDYGDVSIQTAAEVERFLFEQVPHPTRVALRITELVEENKKKHHLVAM